MLKFLTDLVLDYENGKIEDIEDFIYEVENLIKKINGQKNRATINLQRGNNTA